jgi:type I restriction enzyme S subunit
MKPTDAIAHPADWDITTVGKSAVLKRGVSWAKDQEYGEPRDGRVPVLRIGNVQDTLRLDSLLYLSDLSEEVIRSKRVTAGWTLIVGSNGNRARVGNAVFVREDADYLFASFLLGARPKTNDDLTPDYFYRWLTSEQVQAYLSASSEGTTGLNNLSHSFFRAMAIPVPPREEQGAICRVLNAVDAESERTRAAITAAQTVKRALVQRLLSEGRKHERQQKTAIGMLPASWEVVPLRQVVSSFQYGLSIPMEPSGALPILRMGNIQDGDVRLNDLKYVTLPGRVEKAYVLRRGDVLFNRTNSQEWVGKVGIYRHDTPSVFASYLIRVVYDPTQVDPYFLGHVLNSYEAQCRIKRYATPGVQQVNINAKNLGKVLIPLPPGSDGLREQQEIAARLEAAHALVSSYEPVLMAQRTLKRSLMNDLVTGRVRLRETSTAAAR